MVKIVEAEFSIELNELITAPVSAASITPRSWGGKMRLIKYG